MAKKRKDDFEAREKKARALIMNQAERAVKLRSKDREFHGLEREFLDHQAQMLVDYNRTKDVKHPRDVGSAREQILRKFLTESGYLPKRFAVSDRSIRVASTSGHISNEIDIAIYDPTDSISLMNREDVYQVLPVESVYGVIQMKSRLNKNEIRDGLANLASFKMLERARSVQEQPFMFISGQGKSNRGFGILFAYDSDLEWVDIAAEIEAFAKGNEHRNWANAVFILNKGFFFHGREGAALFANQGIETIERLQMHGYPDREGLCLYQFQSLLMNLLRNTLIQPAEFDPYFRLPLVAEGLSYRFVLGPFAEMGTCEAHGDFARKISSDKLQRVIEWCRQTQPINWVKATHLAFGMPEDEEAYRRQPGMVHIYNPENLSLKDILTVPKPIGDVSVLVVGYDLIESVGMNIAISFYYTVKEGIVSGCPKCDRSSDGMKKKA